MTDLMGADVVIYCTALQRQEPKAIGCAGRAEVEDSEVMVEYSQICDWVGAFGL